MGRVGAAVWIAVAVILAAGCGRGRGDSASSGGAPAAAVPTMPSARFAQPTTMIQAPGSITASEGVTDSAIVSVTEGVSETAAAATPAETPTAAPAAGGDFTRGMNSYANRGCAECHGAEGEGVEGKGAALAGTALSEEEFTDVVRTGGKGALGPNHIYGPGAISPGGLSSMYAWLASLGE